jgi:5-methylcytosine-specific restriction endonuclease McrA
VSLIIGRSKEEIKARRKAVRAEFVRLYDLDKLRVELYAEQQGLCAICKMPLQLGDMHIDHAISVFMFAESSLSTEEAVRQANLRNNLLGAHPSCNADKGGLDYEEHAQHLKLGETYVVNNSKLKAVTQETEKEETKDVGLILPAGLLARLDRHAKKEDASRLSIIRKALVDFLNEAEGLSACPRCGSTHGAR